MVLGGAVFGFTIGGLVVVVGLRLVDRVTERRIVRRAARLSRASLRLP
jgi:hypothetical protein